MGRRCSAERRTGFNLKDNQILTIYESEVRVWSNGGAYVPIPKDYENKKVYVVIKDDN